VVETFWTPPLILNGLPAAERPNCERQANTPRTRLAWNQALTQNKTPPGRQRYAAADQSAADSVKRRRKTSSSLAFTALSGF
jgi:hypothetical protein